MVLMEVTKEDTVYIRRLKRRNDGIKEEMID